MTRQEHNHDPYAEIRALLRPGQQPTPRKNSPMSSLTPLLDALTLMDG